MLMFAPPDSKEVGLAYANRSSCFLFLNMFEQYLKDIETAEKSNYLEHTKNENENLNPIMTAIRESLFSFEEHRMFAGVEKCMENMSLQRVTLESVI